MAIRRVRLAAAATLVVTGAAAMAGCADQGLWAKSLTWSSWSATSATAAGIITWHVCTPNWAQSTMAPAH